MSRAGAWLLMAILLTSSWTLQTTAEHESNTQTVVDYVDLSLAGGTVTVSTKVLENAGPRFLEFIEPPTFTRTEQARNNPELVPGRNGDQGGEKELLVTQRSNTDYDYMKKDWTGSLWMNDVHAPKDAWLCVCDAEFVMANENGRPPELGPDSTLELYDSSRIWFDNITFYGAGIVLSGGEHFILSNSHFVDSAGIVAFGGSPASDHGIVHNNTFMEQWGPLQPVHHPPQEIGDLLGTSDPMCWPHTVNPCGLTGASIVGSKNWTFEWNHIHGHGGFFSTGEGTIMRHNTLYDSGHLAVRKGTNEIAWNLIRGRHSRDNLDARASTYTEIHNNSIISPFKADHGGIDQSQPGLRIVRCETCYVRDNDFIGYGQTETPLIPVFLIRLRVGQHALSACGPGTIDVNDNYWGSHTDPREPEGRMIRTCEGAEVILDDWQTEPNHPLAPIVLTNDLDDPPYWVERITRDNTPKPLDNFK